MPVQATCRCGTKDKASLFVVAKAATDFMSSVGKGTLVEQPPQIVSWLTVHDSSTSYHGRHYHRDQALTAVLYLDVNSRSVRPDTIAAGLESC
jgi:hypothetical protein